MNWIAELVGMGVFSFLLVWSTRISLRAFDRLVVKLKIKGLALAAILVALSTSIPELFVGVTSALEKQPLLSMGNLLGANIINVSLVIGGAAVVSGTIPVVGDFVHREFGTAFLAGILPLMLLLDGTLGRFDGIVLLLSYAIYVRDVVIAGKHESLAERGARSHGMLTRLRWLHENHIERAVMELVGGLLVLALSANLLVKISSNIALDLGVPVFLVGLIVLALGTALPELILALSAARRKEIALILGNLLGTIVTNSTLVLGLVAVIKPIEVEGLIRYAWGAICFVLIFGLFWLFTMTKRKLSRAEGLVLWGLYLMFLGGELWLIYLR